MPAGKMILPVLLLLFVITRNYNRLKGLSVMLAAGSVKHSPREVLVPGDVQFCPISSKISSIMQTTVLEAAVKYIDSWLAFRYSRLEMPGFTVAIRQKDKLLYSRAFGYADLATKTKLTTDHIFRIASHSKTFTATAIMQLQETGQLKIDDPAVQYVPWLMDHTDTRWQQVTIRQLLSHSAGVIRDGLDCDYWPVERPFPDFEEFKRELLRADLVIDNNTKLKYSN